MDAWKAKGTSVALAAMGLVATLVGMALVESGEGALARGETGGAIPGGPELVAAAGEMAVLAGGSLMIGAIFVYVLATRRVRAEAAAEPTR